MASTLTDRVGQFAIYSRILVILMQVFFNSLMPDHNADAFKPPHVHRRTNLDVMFEFCFNGIRRWDANYFLFVAENGYAYENSLAFFPLFPLTIRAVGNTLLLPLQYVMTYSNVLLLAAVLINVYLFVKSAKVLHELGVLVLGNETLAFKAAQLYCINPASIFFTAGYSETMFAFLTLNGMLAIQKENSITASLWFAMSGLARSNGLVNFGFILYYKLTEFIARMSSIRNADMVDCGSLLIALLSTAYLCLGSLFICGIISILPFACYQLYAYKIFCMSSAKPSDFATHVVNFGDSQGYKMPFDENSEWCQWTMPLSYSYIQDKYWDVGFLRYFQFKQIPNFALASPMILLCCMAVGYFIKKNGVYFFCMGLSRQDFYKKFDEEKSENESESIGLANRNCFVYIVHLLFLVSFAFFFMHVQVTTRFICSSSPAIFWFVATVTTSLEQLRTAAPRVNRYDVFHQHASRENGDVSSSQSPTEDYFDWDGHNSFNKVLFAYFHLYFFVGIAAFSNFLPWT